VLQILEAKRKATGFYYRYNIFIAVGALGLQCCSAHPTGHDGYCYLLIRRGDVPDLTADLILAEKELGFRAKKDLASQQCAVICGIGRRRIQAGMTWTDLSPP
jgi:hypothetical protein